MAHHHIAHVSLTPQQVVRLASGLTIQLRHHQLLAGTYEVHLTHQQATRVTRARQARKGVRLQLSDQQLRSGGGFLDQLKRIGRIAKAVITRHLPAPRNTIPPAVRTFLAKHGQEQVTRLAVGRLPVHGVITKLLNLLSLGKFDQVRKELGIVTVWQYVPVDDSFHWTAGGVREKSRSLAGTCNSPSVERRATTDGIVQSSNTKPGSGASSESTARLLAV